jgi:hypothetical protein
VLNNNSRHIKLIRNYVQIIACVKQERLVMNETDGHDMHGNGCHYGVYEEEKTKI